MAMGTSVGTISVLTPIACAVSQNGSLPLTLCVGVIVGGASVSLIPFLFYPFILLIFVIISILTEKDKEKVTV